MAVVIRLQGLRITAGSEDIRNFFTGLRIPDGGVHIIGGDLEEAFIIFMSDEDARRAMTRSGGLIKGSRVNLLLSSKSEMQSVLEESARKSEAKARGLYKEVVSRPSQEPGRLTFNKEPRTDIRRPDHLEMRNRPSPSSTSESRSQSDASNRDGLYMKLVGLPFIATKEDILNFFKGLQVDDIVISRNHHGAPSGQGFVRFASRDDTIEGMKRDYQYIGPRYIKLSRSTEEVWLKAGGSVPHKKHSAERARSRSPVSVRSCTPPHEDFCVLFENLSFTVEKRDLRALLLPVVVKDSQITVFNPKKEDKSRSAVVVFKSLEDYCAGLSHNKKPFLHKMLYVSPISKEKMVSMLMAFVDSREEGLRRTSEGPASQRSTPDSELRCVYVRNLPFDVRKVEVIDFFHGFGLSEEKVILLRDEQGVGLGEALVIFQSGKEALMAQSLNGQRFLGSEVMLRCISMTQMQDFGLGNQQLATRPQERIYQRLEGQVNDGSFNDGPSFSNQMFRDGPDVQPGLHHSDRDRFDQNFAPNRFRAGRDEEQTFYGSSDQQFEGPTCVKLYNLPSHIRIDEIYDFCYGYSVIPGSASFEYGRDGGRSRSATVRFETHREALVALEELRGRPIGTRKIQTAFV